MRPNDIAITTYGVDQLALGPFVDLRSKPAYMSFDNFRSWIEVESPNILQYHNPGHNSFSVLHQVSEKLELAG